MKTRLALAAAMLLTCVTALSAHHTVVRLFETAKLVTLQGTLTRIDWRDPHVILRLETRRGDGTPAGWSVETRNPQGLAQAGLSRDSFHVGDTFSATVCVAKDGTRWAVTHDIVRPGGVVGVGVGGC